MAAISRWAFMPEEILLHFFSFLDARGLVSCEKTCKTWQKVASDPSLWKNLTMNFDGGEVENHLYRLWFSDPSTSYDWKNIYQARYIKNLNKLSEPPVIYGSRDVKAELQNLRDHTVNNEFLMLAAGAAAPIMVNFSGKLVKSVVSTVISRMTFNIFTGDGVGGLLGGTVSVVVAVAAMLFCMMGAFTSDNAVGPLVVGLAMSAVGNAMYSELSPGAGGGIAFLCLMVFFAALLKN